MATKPRCARCWQSCSQRALCPSWGHYGGSTGSALLTPRSPIWAPVPLADRMMMEERGRAAVPNTGSPSVSSNARSGGPLCVPHASPPASPPDVQFITEEKFDFGVLSPSDRSPPAVSHHPGEPPAAEGPPARADPPGRAHHEGLWHGAGLSPSVQGQQPKPRSSTATPTRAPRARPTTTTTTTTTTSTVPRSRPPPPSAIPKPPGRAATSGTAPGGRGQPRPSTAAPRGAPLGVGAASRCRLGPPSSRLQPPRKTAASSAPR
ncbi:proline/serine-rich coiled-coil protein 1 isoform X8 [Excalfactoria chinensis]|uniref:proline/serine-rich coiled-coil protein 1 isoform X8 n=1 Tax=Excalfactoria chinensis TaxID=46218 RepID=UPI003B3B21D0